MTRTGRWVDPFAGQPGRRTFVAVPLPRAAVDGVAEIVQTVRGAGLPPGMRDVRWVRLDGLHLTIRFLGPTTDELVVTSSTAIERAASMTAPIAAELGGSGTFPADGRPRSIWIGVAAGAEALDGLARLVGRELEAVGWPADARPFRPHLTLARSDGVAAGRLVADRLAAEMEGRRIPVTLDRVNLFESITGGGPARYLPISEARFVAT